VNGAEGGGGHAGRELDGLDDGGPRAELALRGVDGDEAGVSGDEAVAQAELADLGGRAGGGLGGGGGEADEVEVVDAGAGPQRAEAVVAGGEGGDGDREGDALAVVGGDQLELAGGVLAVAAVEDERTAGEQVGELVRGDVGDAAGRPSRRRCR
jgi:hypothetical protein